MHRRVRLLEIHFSMANLTKYLIAKILTLPDGMHLLTLLERLQLVILLS